MLPFRLIAIHEQYFRQRDAKGCVMEKMILSEFGRRHENAGLFLRENRRRFGGVGAVRADNHDNRYGGAGRWDHKAVSAKPSGESTREGRMGGWGFALLRQRIHNVSQ